MTSVLGNLDLAITEEQSMLLDVAREFCRNRTPMEVVRGELESEHGFDAAIWQEMVELGWTGIALPEDVGGSAMGPGSVVPVVEAMGKAFLGTPLISTTLAGQLLLRAGGMAVEPWLRRIVAGEIATVAELESGDWGSSRIGVSLDDDGTLDGAKHYVTDAGVADFFVVVATRNGAPVLAVVEASAVSEGAVAPNALIDLTKRTGTATFTGARASLVLDGEAITGALRDYRLLGALFTAAEATGSAARTLDAVVDYLKTRKQFGKLIGSYQALKHPTVDMYCGLETSRSFVWHAATVVGDGPLDRDAEVACRMAKAAATDLMAFAGDRSVQFHGGIGFTWDCDTTLFIRRAQWTRQQFGDAAHHRQRLAPLLFDPD